MGASHRDIEAKKAELEMKLSTLEGNLDRSFEQVRTGVSESLSLKKIVKRYPLQIVGLSVLAGFLAGKPRKGSKPTSSRYRNSSDSGEDVFSFAGRTLKKRITQKVVDTIMDIMEEQLARAGRSRDNK